MKTMERILIILIAALMVIGVAYTALASVGSDQASGPGEAIGRPTPPDGASSANGFSGARIDRGHDQGGSFETVGHNLLLMAVIIVSVQVVWAIGQHVNKRHLIRS